ncbi:hypothetical protein PflQ8_0847 [Pseudomonas fluorescens Q8r1-96]|nr:hypothetical protein PflQ8_0847 [Pseudomonas fluorescens Q8r1-96]
MEWVSRHGCRDSRAGPWMALRGGPTEQCLRSGMPSLSEAPSGGAYSVLLTFALLKSEPPSGRNPKQPLPQQWICTRSTRPAIRSPSRARPLPHLDRVRPGEPGRLSGRLASKLCSHRPDGCMTRQPRPQNNKAPPSETAGCAGYHPQLMSNDGATSP